MDIQGIIDGLTPKDYRKALEAEDRIEFDKQYPNADEQLQFLASHKALPYQNDVESFENPGFFTRLRRDALGIYTGPEKALMKKQERLLQDQYEPIQKARQQVGIALMHELARAPETTGEAPSVDHMLGFGGAPQPQAQAASNGLLPAPPMMQQAPQGDPAMAGLPLGAESAAAAAGPQISPIDPPATAMTLNRGGMVMAPGDGDFTPIVDPNAPPEYDYQGRLMPAPVQQDLIEQPIRPEPIAMAERKVLPAPPLNATPRQLKTWERLQSADALRAQAHGTLMPDETGKLVPASLVTGENSMMKAPDIEAAARIYGVDGLQVAPGTRLKAGTVQNALATRIKASHENMPEIVKLQNQADKLPADSERRAELETRIDRLKTNGAANITEVAAAQAEFASLPSPLQTSQNAALIAKQHKNVLTEDVLKGIKNPNQPLVNVNTGVTASEEASKEFMKSTRATYDQLKSAPTALANIEIAKTLIPSAKGFMGPGGETLLDAAKFLNNRLGTKIDTTGIKDAEELRSRIFFNIMDSLKKMDAQPSELQQRVMMDSLGKLGTDPNALGNVLDAFADSIRGKVEQHNSEVSSAESRGTRFPYNPIIKLPEKKAAAMQSTGAVDAYKDPDKEARYQEWKRRQAQ